MPPGESREGTKHIRQGIERVGSGSGNKPRADPFEKKRPNEERKQDFAGGGRLIMGSEFEPALQQEKRRQRARYQEQVIELTAQKSRWYLRLQHPPIERV